MITFDKVVGQEKAKQILNLLADNFHRRRQLPQIGIFGQSGLGKTFIINEFAAHIGAEVLYVNGTAINDAVAFRSIFKDASKNTGKHYIVFIDECHMLPSKVQENLLSVLEKPSILCTVAPRDIGNINTVNGVKYVHKGDVIREALPDHISFVLATTDPVELKPTILNRLRQIHLGQYSVSEKKEIVKRYLIDSSTETFPEDVYMGIAKRSRNIRHLKDTLCQTLIDLSEVNNSTNIELLESLDDLLGIDSDGATDTDIDYLYYLANNGICGLDTLAGVLGYDKRYIRMYIESFLLGNGWIDITSKGRKLTQSGFIKLGLNKEMDNG